MFNTQRLSERARSLAVIGLLVGLAASGTPALAQAKEPVTLTIVNSQWLDALRGKNLWNAMLKYQSVAPNVTLVQSAIPSAEIDAKLMTELAGGQGPDIAIMQEGLFYAAADAGFLIDIGKATEGVKTLNNTNANGVVNGKRLGIAWQRAAYSLIYNKALLDKAGAKVPATVDELIASAKAVNTATGAIGFTSRHQMADFAGFYMDFQNWAYGYGVNWVDAKGNLTIDTPEAVAAITAFKKMYDAKIIPVGDAFTTQRTRFKENQVGLSIDNSGGTLNIASGGALPASQLYAAPLPFKNPGAHQQLFLSVSKHSKNPKAAIDFLAWLVTPAGQQALREASGPDALATDVPLTAAFKAANPWAETFNELSRKSRSMMIPGHETDTQAIMRVVMDGVEKVMLSNADPKAALAEAQKKISAKF